jgi:hypothetical protein
MAELVAAPSEGIGPGTSAGAAECTPVPAQRPILSVETTGLLEDTLNPTVRPGPARALLAATTMADRQGAFRHAEAPASVAEGRVVVAEGRVVVAEGRVVVAEGRVVAAEDLMVAVAGISNRGLAVFPVDRFRNGEVTCGERS